MGNPTPNSSTTKIGIALYYYCADVLHLIEQYIDEGKITDRPGCLIRWHYLRVKIDKWLEIGRDEPLVEVNVAFKKFA